MIQTLGKMNDIYCLFLCHTTFSCNISEYAWAQWKKYELGSTGVNLWVSRGQPTPIPLCYLYPCTHEYQKVQVSTQYAIGRGSCRHTFAH